MMRFDIIVVGASIGGLKTLSELLSTLPADFPLPVVIVQHRDRRSDETLEELLQKSCRLPVRQVDDKDEIAGGHVYLAPADYHLLIDRGSFSLSTEAPVSYARPSVDVLFDTAAASYGNRVLAVVLSGANADGAQGADMVEKAGGSVLIQDLASSEGQTMPRAALAATRSASVMTVSEIGDFLKKNCCAGVKKTNVG